MAHRIPAISSQKSRVKPPLTSVIEMNCHSFIYFKYSYPSEIHELLIRGLLFIQSRLQMCLHSHYSEDPS